MEDYSKKKLTQYTTIKGECINYDICKGTFSKQYMALLDNQNCSNCANDNKFSYKYLMSFCKENDIELLKDYSTIKISSQSQIEAKCPNYNECKGITSKRFITFCETPICHDCVINNKHSYSSLIKYSEENELKILKDYSNQKLNKLSVIEGNCKNYDVCCKTFKKTFGRLLENPFCSSCATLSEYNYYSLINFCKEHNLTLLNDYSKIKVNCNTLIRGNCSNHDKCNGTFNKSFIKLKNNKFCEDCNKKIKIKYNINTLNDICEENNIKLLKEYTNDTLSCDVIIIGECINYTLCNNIFEKSFINLYNYKNVTNGYCEDCTEINRQNRRVNTCLEKYGVEYSSQSNEVREKVVNTCLNKYGYESALQHPEIIEKRIETNKIKYGCENPMQNEEIKIKTMETNLLKYGYTCPALHPDIIAKREETNLKVYGVKHVFSSEQTKEKIKAYNLENYGVEYYFQSEDKKEKSKKTCLEKYGVEHPMQNPEISEKASKNAYQMKKYTLPSGKIIDYQGYENYALDIILKDKKINENDIISKRTEVPKIYYKFEDKERIHFVDIYIKSKNRCIEVKSTWTFEKNKDKVFEKQKAGKKTGFEYEIWIFDNQGNLVDLYD